MEEIKEVSAAANRDWTFMHNRREQSCFSTDLLCVQTVVQVLDKQGVLATLKVSPTLFKGRPLRSYFQLQKHNLPKFPRALCRRSCEPVFLQLWMAMKVVMEQVRVAFCCQWGQRLLAGKAEPLLFCRSGATCKQCSQGSNGKHPGR